MKYNILITDILIKDFVHVYKKDFSVDCLWKLKNKIDYSKYQGIVAVSYTHLTLPTSDLV